MVRSDHEDIAVGLGSGQELGGAPALGTRVMALEALTAGGRVVVVPLAGGGVGLRRARSEDMRRTYRLVATETPGAFDVRPEAEARDELEAIDLFGEVRR